MVLESTMICLDNSEWMRNGDYIPTRLEAQHDAANLLCGAKTQSNPESTVGVLTMAGRNVEVLVSPTEDLGKLLAALHGVPVCGQIKLSNAVQVAQLALKHRRNKKGAQRIIVFVGSPVSEDKATLVKLAKLLKKNNVAVDIVSLGEIDENQEKLQAFVEAVDSNNNSHLVTIPPGVLPSDVLVSSPVVHGGEGGAAVPRGEGAFGDFGGVDPSMDPELALALRVSMEEERARQEAAARKAAEEAAQKGEAVAPADSKSPAPAPGSIAEGKAAPAGESDELLRKALSMSMGETGDEDPELAMALQMSMQDATAAQPKPPSPPPRAAPASPKKAAAAAPSSPKRTPAPAPAEAKPSQQQAFLDPSFVSSLLSGLQGVDANDPRIQAAMAQISNPGRKEEKKEDKQAKDKDAKK